MAAPKLSVQPLAEKLVLAPPQSLGTTNTPEVHSQERTISNSFSFWKCLVSNSLKRLTMRMECASTREKTNSQRKGSPLDTLFLIISKTAWLFLRPETLLVLLFVWPLVLLWRERVDAATNMLFFALCVSIIIGLLPIGKAVLTPLERSYPANPEALNPAGIIVLGGMEELGPEYGGQLAQVNAAGERLIVAMELAGRFPQAPILYSGGKVGLTPSAAGSFSVGPDILRRLGLPEDRLIVEDRSRTTAENAALALQKVPDQDERPWLLVTSAWHMPRALGTFCAAGWRNLVPYPVDFRGGSVFDDVGWNLAENLSDLNSGVKEWIGLLGYKVGGRTEAFLPGGCD